MRDAVGDKWRDRRKETRGAISPNAKFKARRGSSASPDEPDAVGMYQRPWHCERGDGRASRAAAHMISCNSAVGLGWHAVEESMSLSSAAPPVATNDLAVAVPRPVARPKSTGVGNAKAVINYRPM